MSHSKLPTGKRPKFLNLFQIRLPITGIVSIAHRISGVLLFLALPVAIYLFTWSLKSEAAFQEVKSLLATPLANILGIVILWSILHHFVAGIRYLIFDLDIGLELKSARITAYLTMILVLASFIITVTWWWL